MVSNLLTKTLAYADIFDYPLTAGEVWRFIISVKKVNREEINRVLSQKLKKVKEKDGYYCFTGREKIIEERKKREKESLKKLKVAKRIASYIAYIPTVYLVGISGNLALRNSREHDDIDLFIITKEQTLWITRLLVIIVLITLGLHRNKFNKDVRDKICINMFLDKRALCLPRHKQNLYTAHEVIQMLPLFDRFDMYNKFIAANRWVKKFLPNSLDIKISEYKDIKERSSQNIFLALLECIAKSFQLWHMKDHRSTEIISDTMLAFHPNDYRKSILFSYKQKLKKYV